MLEVDYLFCHCHSPQQLEHYLFVHLPQHLIPTRSKYVITGTLNSNGNSVTLNAPQSPGSYTLTATSVEDTTKKATATITVEEMTEKVCEGDAVIDGKDTAGDIARVQGCSEIRGSLKIYSTDLTDLTALRTLQTVTGDVCIGCYDAGNNSWRGNAALTSLAGLDNLSSVAGGLYINTNAALTSLAGLDNLSSVEGYLYIRGNDALTGLSGLEQLREVKGEERIISDNVLFDCTPYN